jgi:rhodanese-related sulfurtransferase
MLNARRPLFLVLALLIIGVGVFMFLTRQEKNPELTQAQTELGTISIEELAQKIVANESMLLLDIRPKTDYLASHIPDAISMPPYDISLHTDELSVFKEWQTILVCENDSCASLATAVRDLEQIGFSNMRRLEGGFEAYAAANLSLASQAKLIQEDLVNLLKDIDVPTISVAELKTKLEDNNTFLVDVRTPFEFINGFIPGAINVQLSSFGEAIDKGLFPAGKTIILYDRKGNRSSIGAQALIDKGFANVLHLDGGIEAWQAQDGELEQPADDASNLRQLIPLLPAESTQ